MFKVLTFFAELRISQLLLSIRQIITIPIEVLALDLDIGHAISNLPLSNFPRSFLLTGTHFGGFCAVRCVNCGLEKNVKRKSELWRKKIF
jgi:hypothetical protein